MAQTGPEGQPTDAMLVAAVLRGDRGAFDGLVERYQRPANSLAWRLLGNADDAQEVVQEAFLRAYRSLGRLDVPEHFRAWLMRIVANGALNFRRGRALRRTLRLEPAGEDDENAPQHADPRADSPAEMAAAGELSERIEWALQRLSDRERQALVLFSLEGLAQKEVAAMLGISVEAVKWHVFQARKKLKDLLAEWL